VGPEATMIRLASETAEPPIPRRRGWREVLCGPWGVSVMLFIISIIAAVVAMVFGPRAVLRA
jgi:hypothetical protein